MKGPGFFFLLLLFVPSCFGQTTPQLDPCKGVPVLSPDVVLPPEACSWIVRYLASSGEHADSISLDGNLFTVSSDGIIHERPLPIKLRSTIMLLSTKKMIETLEEGVKEDPSSENVGLLTNTVQQWPPIRDLYCSNHPGESYTDFSETQQVCPGSQPNSARVSSGMSDPSRILVQKASNSGNPGAGDCHRAITFAMAQNGGLAFGLPNISHTWFDKFEKKYPNVCFTQYGARFGEKNYLVILSSSAGAFNGLQPVFRTNTVTSPIAGSATVADDSGDTWDVTYQGTEITSTTTQSDVPFTDTVSDFYANAYDEGGALVGTSERSSSTREGGDPYNAAGYNMTSALLSIHLKEHLLETIIKKVSTLH